jgi:hypothetical protein
MNARKYFITNFYSDFFSLSDVKIPHFFFYNCQQRVFVLRVECTFFNGVDKEEESFVIVVVVVVRFLILLL